MGVLSLDAQKTSVTLSELGFEILSNGEGPTLQPLILYHMSFLPVISVHVSLGLLGLQYSFLLFFF